MLNHRQRALSRALPRLAAAACAVALWPAGAHASQVGDFYRNKTITFLIGSDPGGAFDTYGRLLAEHMPKYIETNPKIIVRYTGGQSGGLQLAEQMHNTVARDGLTMAMTTQSVVNHQVLRPAFAKYDARQWFWLGNMAPQRSVLAIWHTAQAQSLEEAVRKEVVIGATAQSSPTYMIPDVASKFLGAKFKIVTGYKNVVDMKDGSAASIGRLEMSRDRAALH